MAGWRRVVLAGLAIAWPGCFSPDIEPGLLCGPGDSCPPGQLCNRLSGLCEKPSSNADADADAIDAAVVDGAAVADADSEAPDSSSIDAPLPDASGYSVIETMTIPVDGSSVTSTTVLSSTGDYRLRCYGTFITGGVGDMMGDCEYHDFSAPDDNNAATGLDNGMSIDNPTVGMKPNHWGPYTTTHDYEVPFTGKDAAISVNYHDNVYSNNFGSVTIEIKEAP